MFDLKHKIIKKYICACIYMYVDFVCVCVFQQTLICVHECIILHFVTFNLYIFLMCIINIYHWTLIFVQYILNISHNSHENVFQKKHSVLSTSKIAGTKEIILQLVAS